MFTSATIARTLEDSLRELENFINSSTVVDTNESEFRGTGKDNFPCVDKSSMNHDLETPRKIPFEFSNHMFSQPAKENVDPGLSFSLGQTQNMSPLGYYNTLNQKSQFNYGQKVFSKHDSFQKPFQESNGLISSSKVPVIKKSNKSSAIIPTWINIPNESRFYIIKSNNLDHIKRSFYNSMWSSTHFGNKRLSDSYQSLSPDGKIFLFFSVNGSGKFCGVAEMTSDLREDLDTSIWNEKEKFGRAFKVRWVIVRDINNRFLKRFLLPNNEMKPVTNSRDTQEIPFVIGCMILKLFKSQTLDIEVKSFLDIDY